MAELKMGKIDDFIDLCFLTNQQLDRLLGRAIYKGGKVMGNAVGKAVKNIPVDTGSHHHRKRTGITPAQKQGLMDSYGIARIKRGKLGLNVKLGFDGYNDVITKRWPKGQPNAMIARAINSGTSFMRKTAFMDTTVQANESATLDAIEKEFDKQVDRLFNRDKL